MSGVRGCENSVDFFSETFHCVYPAIDPVRLAVNEEDELRDKIDLVPTHNLFFGTLEDQYPVAFRLICLCETVDRGCQLPAAVT